MEPPEKQLPSSSGGGGSKTQSPSSSSASSSSSSSGSGGGGRGVGSGSGGGGGALDPAAVSKMGIREVVEALVHRGVDFADCLDIESLRECVCARIVVLLHACVRARVRACV